MICSRRDTAQVLFGRGASAPDRSRAATGSAMSWAAANRLLRGLRHPHSCKRSLDTPKKFVCTVIELHYAEPLTEVSPKILLMLT